jgi:hypothetical protein
MFAILNEFARLVIDAAPPFAVGLMLSAGVQWAPSSNGTMVSTERLHALLQSILAELDRFAAHLYQSRREYRRTSEIAGKSGKRIERCVISTFQIAEQLDFRGDFRRWEHLLQIGE